MNTSPSLFLAVIYVMSTLPTCHDHLSLSTYFTNSTFMSFLHYQLLMPIHILPTCFINSTFSQKNLLQREVEKSLPYCPPVQRSYSTVALDYSLIRLALTQLLLANKQVSIRASFRGSLFYVAVGCTFPTTQLITIPIQFLRPILHSTQYLYKT